MLADTQPGTTIQITVAKQPTNAAAAKTLVRLFSKDPARRKVLRRTKTMFQRAVRTRQRGGRQWAIRPRRLRPVPPCGESCTIPATPDVLRDLVRLERFVTLKPSS
ncbi:MAG: hypothetical protein ACE5F9_10960 [Phycisphaerae bacterium]